MTWDDYESGPYCKHWNTPGDCDKCREEIAAPYVEVAVKDEREAARERAIRAVVAAQWGVACVLASCGCGCGEPRLIDPEGQPAARLAVLPTAVEIVDGNP